MTMRELFVRAAAMFEGCVVLMGELDCSDLVARCRFAAGATDVDERKTHRAQDYSDQHPALALVGPDGKPLKGELLLYGVDWKRVTHIAIAGGGGKVISADGATGAVKTLAEAVAHTDYRVRIHAANNWRADFLGARHHTELED